MSSNGQVIFGLVQYGGPLDADTYRWTAGGGIQQLFANPGSYVSLFGTTSDGMIAIGAGFNGAYIWRNGLGFRNFITTLNSEFGISVGAQGQVFPFGISADGRTIVGNGNNGTTAAGFVVTLPVSIPSPGAGAALIVGTFAARRRRRP